MTIISKKGGYLTCKFTTDIIIIVLIIMELKLENKDTVYYYMLI